MVIFSESMKVCRLFEKVEKGNSYLAGQWGRAWATVVHDAIPPSPLLPNGCVCHIISQNMELEMGGMGSGRWGSGRRKVEQMLQLDIAQLQRQGLSRVALLQVRWPSGATISIIRTPTDLRLLYRVRSGEKEWQSVEERVPLVATQQRLGGQRQWFECPGCGRRVRILYAAGPRFRCRRCHRLSYSSQSEGLADRANRGMSRIVKLLDPDERRNDLPARPKGMHWRTYQRLVERFEFYDEQWTVQMLRRLAPKL